MPDLQDIHPSTYTDPAQREAQQQRINEAARPFDLLDTAQEAYRQHTIIPKLGPWWHRTGMGYDADPNFHLTPEILTEASKGIPTDRLDVFAGAHSLEQLQQIRYDEQERMRSLDILSRGKYTGGAMGMAFGLSDPVALAAMAMTGGTSEALLAGGQAGRVGMAIRSGLAMSAATGSVALIEKELDPSVSWWEVGGAAAGGFGFGAASRLTAQAGRVPRFFATGAGQAIPSTALNLTRAAVDPNYEAEDAIYSGMVSYGMGGLFGLGKPHDAIADHANAIRREIEYKDITDAGLKPTPQGKIDFAEQIERTKEEATATKTVQAFVDAHSPSPTDGVVETHRAATFRDANIAVEERVRELTDRDGWSAQDAIAQAELEAENAKAKVVPIEAPAAVVEAAKADVKATEVPTADISNTSAPAAGEPSIAEQLTMFADKLETSARKSRQQNQIPRGPNTGASIDPVSEVRDMAKIVLAKAIRAGVYTGKELQRIVDEIIAKEAPHLAARAKDVYRMASNAINTSLSSDGRLLPDRLSDAVGPAIDRAAFKKDGAYDLSHATDEPIAYARLMQIPVADHVIEVPYTPRGWTAAQQIATPGKDPSLRLFGKLMGASGNLADSKGGPAVESPFNYSQRTIAAESQRWQIDHAREFAGWMKEQGHDAGLNPFEHIRLKEQFDAEIARAVRRGVGAGGELVFDGTDFVKSMAKTFAKRRAADLERMQNAGVDGANRVERAENYVPRVPLLGLYNKWINILGDPDIIHELWGRARPEIGVDATPEEARAAGAAYWEIVRRSKLGQNADADPLTLPPSELSRLIRNFEPNEAKANRLIYDLTKARDRGSKSINSLRHRTEIDETFGMNVLDAKGNPVHIGIEDFLENNASLLDRSATSTSIRKSALAEMTRAWNVAHGLSEYGDNDGALTGARNPADLVARLRNEAESKATTKPQQSLIEKDIATAEALIHEAMGGSATTDGAFGTVMKMFRLYNYLRVGGAVGLKHASLFAQAIGEATIPSLARQMPTLMKIINPFPGATAMRMSEPLLRETEAFSTARFNPKFTETFARGLADSGDEQIDSAWLGRMQRPALWAMNRINFLSGFSRMLSQTTSVLVEQRWLDRAFSNKVPSQTFLSQAGIESTEMGQRIMSQLREHATWEQGSFGRKLRTANVNQWSDQVAASRYATSVARITGRVMNSPDSSNTPMWMTSDMGATIAQFKRWPAAAWDNIAMHGVQQLAEGSIEDKARVVAKLGLGLGMGALSYGAIQYLRSIGRKDQDKFLREAFTPGKAAAHAFADSGYAGFIPELSDAAAYPFTKNMPFAHGHEAFNPLTDYPTADAVGGALPALRGMANVVKGNGKRSDIESMRKMTPFGNAHLFHQFWNAVEQNVPERR